MQLLIIDNYLKSTANFQDNIAAICSPLFKNFGLNHFAYNRIYNADGSRFRLGTLIILPSGYINKTVQLSVKLKRMWIKGCILCANICKNCRWLKYINVKN